MPLLEPKHFERSIDAFQRGRITLPPARPHVVESLVEPADAGFTFLFAAGGKKHAWDLDTIVRVFAAPYVFTFAHHGSGLHEGGASGAS